MFCASAGDRLVSGSRDFTVRLWDIERQKVIGGEYIMDKLVHTSDLKKYLKKCLTHPGTIIGIR